MVRRTGLKQSAPWAVLAGWLLLVLGTGGCEEQPIAVIAPAPPGETQANPLAVALNSPAYSYQTDKDAAYFSLVLPATAAAQGYAVWAHPRPTGPTNNQTLSVFANPNFTGPQCGGGVSLEVESCFAMSTGATVYAWVRAETPGQPGMKFLVSALSDTATGTAVTGPSPTVASTPLSLAAGQSFAGSVSSTTTNYFAVTLAGAGIHQIKATGSAGQAVVALFNNAAFSTAMMLPSGACAPSAALYACLVDAPPVGMAYPATVYAKVTSPSTAALAYSLSVIGP